MQLFKDMKLSDWIKSISLILAMFGAIFTYHMDNIKTQKQNESNIKMISHSIDISNKNISNKIDSISNNVKKNNISMGVLIKAKKNQDMEISNNKSNILSISQSLSLIQIKLSSLSEGQKNNHSLIKKDYSSLHATYINRLHAVDTWFSETRKNINDVSKNSADKRESILESLVSRRGVND